MKKIRKDFQWTKNNKKLIYFDNAATTLKPKCVAQKEIDFYNKMGVNIHNTDSSFAYHIYEEVKIARSKIASLFNAKAENICFTSGCTDGLNLIAYGVCKTLKPGDEILLDDLEHASNLLPWYHWAKEFNLKIKFVANDKIPTVDDYLKAITKKTKVISVTGASNVYGNIFDYQKLAIKVKQKNKNIVICLDAAQLLPHCKINTSCGLDFVACSAHKLLGPTGIGAVYMTDKWIGKLTPLKYGGGMNETIDRKGFTFIKGNERFEAGTLPLAQIFSWAQAVDYLDSLGWDNIINHEIELKKYFVSKLKNLNDYIIYNMDSPLSIVILNHKKAHAQDFANWLGSKGIICRAGLSCAKLVNNVLKTDAFVRVSLYVYNTKQEIDKFVSLLKEFKSGDELIDLIK